MALAVQHHADLGFSNSGNYTPSAYDSTGDTWLEATLSNFSSATNLCTVAKYNTTLDLVTFRHDNAATVHRNANSACVMPQALGANAGSHSFNFQWSGGGFLDFQCRSGDGSIDAAVVDGTGFVDAETAPSGGTATPPAYTVTTPGSLPLISFLTSALSGTISANANCTLDQLSGLDSGVGTFHCPIASSTSAVINTSDTGFQLTITYALKAGGGGAGLTETQLERLTRGVGRGMPGRVAA